MWSFALEGRQRREELARAGALPALAAAAELGDAGGRHAALGAVAALLHADGGRWLLEFAGGSPAVAARALAAATAAALQTAHDRSRVEAVRMLAALARAPALAARVWAATGAGVLVPAALGRQPAAGSSSGDEKSQAAAQAAGCMGLLLPADCGAQAAAVAAAAPATAAAVPGWAGAPHLQLAAALALKAALEPSGDDADEAARRERRSAVLRATGGLLGPWVDLAARGAVNGGGGGGSGGDDDEAVQRGLRLAASACLRFVALSPEAAQAAAGEQASHASGVCVVAKSIAALNETFHPSHACHALSTLSPHMKKGTRACRRLLWQQSTARLPPPLRWPRRL